MHNLGILFQEVDFMLKAELITENNVKQSAVLNRC